LTTTDHLTLYIAKKSSVGLGYTIRLKQYCIFKSVACLLACLFVNCFLEVGYRTMETVWKMGLHS